MTDRSEYIAGLRALAEALEADEALPLPYDGTLGPIAVFTYAKPTLAAMTRLLDGKREKEVDESSSSHGFRVKGSIRGLRVIIYADRDQVCTRRVVGTETVTEQIPDPEYVDKAPLVEVTTERQIVEWDCGSLLADEPTTLGAAS